MKKIINQILFFRNQSRQHKFKKKVSNASGPAIIIAEIGISTEKIFIWAKDDYLEVPNSKKKQKEPLCSNDSQTKFVEIRDIFSQSNIDMITKITLLIKPTAEEQCDLSSMESFSFFNLLSGADLEILCLE